MYTWISLHSSLMVTSILDHHLISSSSSHITYTLLFACTAVMGHTKSLSSPSTWEKTRHVVKSVDNLVRIIYWLTTKQWWKFRCFIKRLHHFHLSSLLLSNNLPWCVLKYATVWLNLYASNVHVCHFSAFKHIVISPPSNRKGHKGSSEKQVFIYKFLSLFHRHTLCCCEINKCTTI